MRPDLGSHKISASACWNLKVHLHGDVHGVQSHVPSRWSQKHITLSRLHLWSGCWCRHSGGTCIPRTGKGKEPLISGVQLMDEPGITAPLWPPPAEGQHKLFSLIRSLVVKLWAGDFFFFFFWAGDLNTAKDVAFKWRKDLDYTKKWLPGMTIIGKESAGLRFIVLRWFQDSSAWRRSNRVDSASVSYLTL